MNFKSRFIATTTIAATLATATLVGTPAQAATLNGTLNLSSPAAGGANISNTGINFFGPTNFVGAGFGTGFPDGLGSGGVVADASTGSFAPLPVGTLGIGLIKDLSIPTPTLAQKSNFLALIVAGLGAVTFDLDTFVFNSANRSATFTGFFRNGGDLTAGIGEFTAQSLANPTSYSLSITAGKPIPTPALLPGLIGLGVAALRKRKALAAANADH